MDKTLQYHTKSRQNNLHYVHSRPCRLYELSGHQNKQHCTTHGNVLDLALDPGLTYSTHIHNISVHEHKPLQIIKHSPQQDGVKRRRDSWLHTRQSGDRLRSMPLPYGRILRHGPALTICKSCERSIENCHRMHTTHTHTTYP